MSDRAALVTGASRGIGAATARALADAGWAVGVNYRGDEDGAAATVAAIEAAGGRAVAVQRRRRRPRGGRTRSSTRSRSGSDRCCAS